MFIYLFIIILMSIKELNEKGYCIIENVLTPDEIQISIDEFKKWQNTIQNHDKVHNTIDPHGIYKHHRAGHTRFAWFIRTRPQVQKVFKELWNTDELVVSFDGSCYISKDNTSKDKIWTHTDQSSKSSELQCYQGFVSLTDNKERTFRVYEGSHKLHQSYFKEQLEPLMKKLTEINIKLKEENEPETEPEVEAESEPENEPEAEPEAEPDFKILKTEKTQIEKSIKKLEGNWQLINHHFLEQINAKKTVLNVKAGSLVLWDSRTFHQNQYGEPNSEERMVQYVCYLPKTHKSNTPSMIKKRFVYFNTQRTTSHWPCPIKVNGLQPRTYGDDSKLIDYNLESLPMNDLTEFKDEILKII